MDSSTHRHKAIGRHMPPSNMEQVKSILSDQTDSVFPVFRSGNKEDYVKTVAVGKNKNSIFLRSPTTDNRIKIKMIILCVYDYRRI